MTLEELIGRFRIEADDRVIPYLWESEWVAAWLAEAQNEAALRARLILDDFTPEVTQIAVTSGLDSYALHPTVYEIARVDFVPGGGHVIPIYLTSREKLDAQHAYWRELPRGVPRWGIQTDKRIRLVPVPEHNGTLRLEAYRLPLNALANDNDQPELHDAHHIHLVQWALHKAFGRPDSDSHDPGRSAVALGNFESYFGLRPDADMRRSTRHDVYHANSLFLP